MPTRRPVVDQHHRSNVPGLFIVGDLTGAPVVKIAMEQGQQVARYIASLPDARSPEPGAWDLIVIGAGAAGLNAALEAQTLGLRVLVLEKNKIANTIEDFPEGKWVYAEPDSRPPSGKLWLDGARKEDLIARWHQIILENGLDVRTGEGVEKAVRRKSGGFEIQTTVNRYCARRVVLATGQRGTPRRLGVPGEDSEPVYHRLYSPKQHSGEEILVVGGGNTAVEAALALAEQNQVTLSYRGNRFLRVFKENRRKLEAAVDAGKVRLVLESQVIAFENGRAILDANGNRREIPFHHAFVLVGAEAPEKFLRSFGIRLENDWTDNPLAAAALVMATLEGIWVAANGLPAAGGLAAAAAFALLVGLAVKGRRFAWLGVSALLAYSIYAVKQPAGFEFWPYRGWGSRVFTFFGRPWGFWYTALYTAVMTVFGIQAMRRWGFQRGDRFQIRRYATLIGFQWVFFFLLPEFLFQAAVRYQWVGAQLAADPNFAQNAWRSYGIIYAWPLFFYTFLGHPHRIWIVWGVLLTFVVIPVVVLFHGKRYCSWVCGCGGLAETLGDRWRHLAPKGRGSIRWERMNGVMLALAVVVTLLVLGRDTLALLRRPADIGLQWYHWLGDIWLVSIIPVALYPFFGGKIWCRYWCPLAKMMELASALFTRLRISRFGIQANEKCIACGECTRYCQVGIDVMNYALKQESINNLNSSCIGCGICVSVCPMGVLSFQSRRKDLVQIRVVAAK